CPRRFPRVGPASHRRRSAETSPPVADHPLESISAEPEKGVGMTEGGGFEGSKQALGEVSKQTTWINEQVGAGKLRLDPEAAEKAAKRCREEADALREMANEAQIIERQAPIGSYPDGGQLAARFQQKATD